MTLRMKRSRRSSAMLSLSDLQRRVRDAVIADVSTTADDLTPLLVGGRDPRGRLAIHRRHYESSLVTALMEKFPATTWLTGAGFLGEAARAFVHRHPPSVQCIAEYAEDFPDFLGDHAGAERLPYLSDFARLDWCLGRAAIAVDAPPLALAAFGQHVDTLADLQLTLQQGLHYFAAAWPVDDLIQLYLSNTAPDYFAFDPLPVHLEIRGARGEFQVRRLDAASFAFRNALARGQSISAASEAALDREETFGPGRALPALVADGLVTAITFTDGDSA
jgi:Putative DNA-binding domain